MTPKIPISQLVNVTVSTLFRDEDAAPTVAALISRLRYKKGYRFEIMRQPWLSNSWYLLITVRTIDSTDPDGIRELEVTHSFIPPPSSALFTSDPNFWQRWLLDRVFDVERHEAMEFFKIDGRTPFYPHHNEPGEDPYKVPKERL